MALMALLPVQRPPTSGSELAQYPTHVIGEGDGARSTLDGVEQHL